MRRGLAIIAGACLVAAGARGQGLRGSGSGNPTQDVRIVRSGMITQATVCAWVYVPATITKASAFSGLIMRAYPVQPPGSQYNTCFVFGSGTAALTDETLSLVAYPVFGTVYATGITNNIASGWRHFAARWVAVSNQYFIYVDGNVEPTQTGTIGGNVPLQVGTNWYFADRMTYAWDDLRIYGRSLTPDEIKRIYLTRGRDGIVNSLHVRVRGSRQVGTGATYASGQTWTVEGGTMTASNNVVAAETVVGEPPKAMEY